jgi:hypothetical protein
VIPRQAVAERALRVETQAVGIGYGHQEQLEGAGLMAELIDRVLTDQALIHPAELLGHGPALG